jgi:hypothetical protein
MTTRLGRYLRILIVGALAVAAPTLAGSSFVRVAPTRVPAGDVVRVFGSVGPGCARGDTATLTSRAFSPRHEFAGVPAVFGRVGRNGVFSASTVIPVTRAAGLYAVGGRCGGGNFGHTPLRVNRSAFVDVSPSTVRAGHGVRAFGSVRGGCPRGDTVTITSRAFAPRHEFAGVPAIFGRAGQNGSFSVSTTIPGNRAAGVYSVGGRCGGGNFGHAQLRVR